MIPSSSCHVSPNSDSTGDPLESLRRASRWENLFRMTVPSSQMSEAQVIAAFKFLNLGNDGRKSQPGSSSLGSASSDPLDSLKGNQEWTAMLSPSRSSSFTKQVHVKSAFQVLQNNSQANSRRDTAKVMVPESPDQSPIPSGSSSSKSSYAPPNQPKSIRFDENRGEVADERLSNEVQRLYQLDLVLANPLIWGFVILDISSLRHHEWIVQTVMNFYLLLRWSDLRHTARTHFVDMVFTHGFNSTVVPEEEIALFRQRYTIEPIQQQRVVFIAFHSDHYFTVVFDYGMHAAWVFGSNITRTGCFDYDVKWDEWGGPHMWRKIAMLFRWDDVVDNVGTVEGIDWLQNGYDCGAIAIEVALSIIKYDIQMDERGRVQKPIISCGHKTRSDILTRVSEDVYRYFRIWEGLPVETREAYGEVPDEAMEFVTQIPHWNNTVANVARNIERARVKCANCRDAAKEYLPETNISIPGVIGHSTHEDTHSRDSSPTNGAVSSESDADKSGRGMPPHLRQFKSMKGARNLDVQVPRKSPSNAVAIHIPAKKFIRLPFDRHFDEYFMGPTVEDCLESSICNFPTNPFYLPTRRSCWEYFKDYGYRIEPSFALAFNQQEPILVKNHILPIGPKLHRNDGHINGNYSLSRKCKHGKSGNEKVTVNDGCKMGLEGFIQDAGREGTDGSFDAFVKGINLFGEFINIDPEQDEFPLDDDEILTTIDIDSMIWVTHTLRFRQALKVFVLPLPGNRAPLNHNNHVYCDILLPQSDHDKDQGKRSEWWSKKFPVSSVPHTHFAHLASGAGSINIYVLFPRMIHRDPFTGRRATIIPYEVQSMWLSDVVLPAVVKATDPTFKPYVDFTLEEWKWKATRQKGFSNTKTIPILDTQLGILQDKMRAIIKENTEILDLFGSFFFVADIRGCKGTTHTDDPYASLKKEYPAMDWEHAMKRENGQLFLDLGISYHPNPATKTPLVGLWRNDVMLASYEKAGTNKPTVHHACTLGGYGGMQASTEQFRSQAVQFRFLSSYMLSFESIRRPSADSYFCQDTDAYDASIEFNGCCNKYITLFQGARQKSFGVRHEIRGSGPAILTALSVAKKQAKAFLRCKPILWVKSDIWFNFLSRRMSELRNAQLKLRKIRPPNYGILTSLIMHLIRCVAITPIVIPKYLSVALQDLSFDAVTGRFGMFFLHDIDIEEGTLEGIEEEDDAQVNYAMRLAKRHKKKLPPQPKPLGSKPNAQYPYGDSPTWTTVVDALQNSAETIMQPWIWDHTWDRHPVASRLFVQMTIDIWLTVVETTLNSETPHPTCLDEAMQSWTVTAIQQTFVMSTFIASNADLQGSRTGKKQRSFGNMLEIFFPTQEKKFAPNSVWKPLADKGYIREFHRITRTLSQENVDHLMNALKLIFSNVQCLPYAEPSVMNNKRLGRIWKSSKGMVEMLTNSKFYRLVRIGNGRKKPQTATRIKASNAVISARLDQEHRGIPYQKGRKEYLRSLKSTKSRNYRKPPTRPTKNTKKSSAKGGGRNVDVSDCGDSKDSGENSTLTEDWDEDDEDDDGDDDDDVDGDDESN